MMFVRIPFLRAALSMWCSVLCIVLHVVGLMSCSMGAAYVIRVRMRVLYSSNGMYFGMCIGEFMIVLILFVKNCVPCVILLTCCCRVKCVSSVAPSMVTCVDLLI